MTAPGGCPVNASAFTTVNTLKINKAWLSLHILAFFLAK
jgi:hypothetical protein